jgi:hypothetical protein
MKKLFIFILMGTMLVMSTTPTLAANAKAFCDSVFDTAMTIADARTKGYSQTAVMESLNAHASGIGSDVYAVTSMIINEQYKYAPDAATQLISVRNLYNNCLLAIKK